MIGERNNSTKYVLMLILATMFNATSGIWIRMSGLGPVCTAMWRALLAIPLLAVVGAKGVKGAPKKDILIMLAAGAFLGGELIFFNQALVMTSIANSNLFANMTAVVIVPVSYFLFKEKIPKYFFVGAGIAIIGVVILVNGKANPQPSNYLGDIFAMIVAVLYGIYILIIYKLRDKYPSNSIMFVASISMFAVLLTASVALGEAEVPNTPNEWLVVLLYTVFLQLIGMNLASHCNGYLRVNLSAIIALMQPVFGGIYSWILFNEKLTPMEITGILIVIAGVYLTKREYQRKD